MYQYFLTPLYTSLVLLMVNIHIRFHYFIHCENKDKLNPVQEFMTQEFQWLARLWSMQNAKMKIVNESCIVSDSLLRLS